MTKPASALHPIPQVRLRGRENRPDFVAVGTIVWLASELMFFAALFAAYFTVRNVSNFQAAQLGVDTLWNFETDKLNIPFAILEHQRAGGQLLHVPDGRLRGRARAGEADGFRGRDSTVGSA